MSSNYDALEISNGDHGLSCSVSNERPTDINFSNENKEPFSDLNKPLYASYQIRLFNVDDELPNQISEYRDLESNLFEIPDIQSDINQQISVDYPEVEKPDDPDPREPIVKEILHNPKIEVKMPGETKNLPKCFARQLQQFIENSIRHSDDYELKKVFDNPQVKSFLKLNPEKMGKVKLLEFIGTNIGQIFCQEFFGNCQWNYRLTKESKTNIELCFRHNISYYLEVIKKKRKLEQN